MKKLIFSLAFIFSFIQLFAEGIQFFHGTWQEALDKAKTENKAIFVDAYAEWCGPCKRMAANTFPNSAVGELFNNNFICMKLDMEKDESVDFRKNFTPNAYPTLFFVDGNNKLVHRAVGGLEPAQLIELGKFVLSKQDKIEEMDAEYEKGTRAPDFLRKYAKALMRAGKPSLKTVNEYLNTQKDFTTPDNLKFLLEATSEADSRIFKLLIDNKDKVVTMAGAQPFKDKVEAACIKTAGKAIEFKTEALLTEAKNKMKLHVPEKSANFAYAQDMAFALATNNVKKYLDVCKNYINKEVKNDAAQLNKTAETIAEKLANSPEALSFAEKLAKKASENGGLFNYYYTHAAILYKSGKKEEALKIANKALEVAKRDTPNAAGNVEALIRTIKGEQ
jgi:thioredoxin-related protein